MAPLIFVSDNKVTPSIPRNFFSKSSAHPAEWPKKLLIDKDYSSAPAVMVMTRQALDRMLLSPRHDFTEAIGSASNVYLDERTNRFVQVDRSTDKRQDTRGLGILR